MGTDAYASAINMEHTRCDKLPQRSIAQHGLALLRETNLGDTLNNFIMYMIFTDKIDLKSLIKFDLE